MKCEWCGHQRFTLPHKHYFIYDKNGNPDAYSDYGRKVCRHDEADKITARYLAIEYYEEDFGNSFDYCATADVVVCDVLGVDEKGNVIQGKSWLVEMSAGTQMFAEVHNVEEVNK